MDVDWSTVAVGTPLKRKDDIENNRTFLSVEPMSPRSSLYVVRYLFTSGITGRRIRGSAEARNVSIKGKIIFQGEV